ncbi:sigma-70 family RNA polymerase sigma factor [Kitasatospora sp. NPDC059327]|uniref:sigma-70 family RNA polymerase sigma factor n=1 Tax=Kitasatospora sp. NPDC059327 TaxID=3346803 RepID=UPI0036A3CF60
MPQPPHPADDTSVPTFRQGTAGEPAQPRHDTAAGSDAASDASLIARLRAGDDDVVGTLFERHHRAALGYARSLGGLDHRAEDLASEAFVRTLAAVRAGNGPTDNWRPYLFTVVRNTAVAWAASERRSFPTEDVQDWADEADHALSPDQIVAASAEHHLIVTAFRSLPERWQSVLWHSVVERRPAEEVAPLLGLSASGVSSLASRAREGLRTAYLAAHLSRTQSAECQAYAARLTAHARGTSARRSKALARHLEQCAECRRCDEELRDINRRLRLAAMAFLGPWPSGEAATSALAAHAGSGSLPAPTPHHAPPSSGPFPGTSSKAMAGVLTAGAVVVAAIALTPFLAPSSPGQPAEARTPGPLSTLADGVPDAPAAPTALPETPPPPSAPAPDPTAAAPGVTASPTKAAPPSPSTRPSAPAPPSPRRTPTKRRDGSLTASVQSISTPAAALPGDRRVQLRLATTGTCGEIEDFESTTGTPYFMKCESLTVQSWIVRADRSGGVQIVGAANSGCLESAGTTGAIVTQEVCDGNNRQSWQVVDLTGGESALRQRSSGLLLASSGHGQEFDDLQLRSADCAADPMCRPTAAFRL